MNTFAFWTPGPVEIIICVVLMFLIFGPSRIPKMARGIGSSFTEFKKGLKGVKDEVEDVKDDVKGNVRDINREMRA